jgi:MOSC domain-containing protein YiiM
MTRVEEIHAFAGRGLEGDRYYKKTGTYSKKPGPDREITLIEVEAIEALKRDYGVDLDPGQSRRNILTRGAALNHLVGQEFNVGKVKLRGIRLCEPCEHLARLSGKEVLPGLVHRGGLRAQILTDGLIHTSDPIEIADCGFQIAD